MNREPTVKTEQSAGEAGTKKRKLAIKPKYVVLACAVLAAGVGVWFYLNSPMEVKLETAARGSYADTFTETGVVKGGTSMRYLSEVEAKVAEVPVHRNDRVKAGDLLVRLDTTELEYERETHVNALAQYHAQVSETIRDLTGELSSLRAQREKNSYTTAMEVSPQSYLDIARSQMESAKANLTYWEGRAADLRVLYEAGAEALYNVEEAENQLAEARSACVSAEQKYRDAQSRYGKLGNNVNAGYYASDDRSYAAQIAALEKKLADYTALSDGTGGEELEIGMLIAEEASQIRMLDEKISRCAVRAQQDGLVTELPAEALSRVQPGDPLATVGEDSVRRLEVRALTNQEPYLRVGDAVTLTQKLKSDRVSYEGVIAQIDGYAEKGVSALGADEYRVRVVVDVKNGEALKDGYELDAMFTTYSGESSLSVPNSALFRQDGQDCVFVVSGGKACLRPVELSHRGALRSEIASGIGEGEQIIVDANQKELADGTAVTGA